MNQILGPIVVIFLFSLGLPSHAQRPLPRDGHPSPAPSTNGVFGLSFKYGSELPKKFAPAQAGGTAKIHLFNKTDSFVCLGIISSDGNILHGWSDGNAGHTVFYVSPGKRTNPSYPYLPAVGQPFVIMTSGGDIIGFGQATVEGEYELILE